jgi:two-component system CheB/CheR fusion protein
VRSRPLTVQAEGTAWQVVMSVHPAEDRELRGFLLVIFDELDEGSPPGGEQVAPAADAAGGGARAPDHAAGAFPGIQPSATEADLQASNEELQSDNEELRALIKALESSKEELQSLNEELTTVNDENARRLEELGRLNADLRHFHAATQTPTLFLDRTLSIVRYTPQAEALFRLRASDSGRPLSDLTNRLDYPDLQADARAVLAGVERVEREVASTDGRWFLVRILPYHPEGPARDGVVITLVDITERRRAEQEATAARTYAESIVETLHEPVIVLTPELMVKSVNRAFCGQFRVTREETVGRKIYDLGNGQWDIPSLRQLLEDVLPDNEVFNDYPVVHAFEAIGRRVMLLNARRLDNAQLILLGIRDVTASHDAERALRASEERFRALVNAGSFAVYRMSPDWSEMRELDGRGFIADTAKPKKDWLAAYIHPDDQPMVRAAIAEAVREKGMFQLEHRMRRVDGTLGWTYSRAVPLLDEAGEITEWFGAASDITERREAAETLRAQAGA